MTLQNGYRVIREQAAIGQIARRTQLALTGRDRASYLQGLLTNDIQALRSWSGCYSAWLTPQGRMLTDLHVLESDSMMMLDVPASLGQATLDRVEQFIFSEDVQAGSLATSLTGVWLHGPAAAGVLGRALDGVPGSELTEAGLAAWPDYQHAQARFGGAAAVVARIDQLGVPGYCVYVEPAQEEALLSALEGKGAARVAADAISAVRVEAGYPVFGVDMTEETIPLEAGIEGRAISLTKGCYVGQEVIIRVLHRGHGRVAKRLVGLRIEGQAPPSGARVFAGAKPGESVGREIGILTSVADSPRLGAIAMGYVHRDFVAPGTVVSVATGSSTSGSDRQAATVSAFPMSSAVG